MTTKEKSTVLLKHPCWNDQFCISGNRGFRLHRDDHATVLSHNEQHIILKWDKYGTEKFMRVSQNCYQAFLYQCFDTIGTTGSMETKLLINPFDGQNSVFRKYETPFIGIGYKQWEFLPLLDDFFREIELRIHKMPHLKSVLFTGICKDSTSSLCLALRLKEKYPHLNIGVWGCPWAGDFSKESPVYNGIVISPAHVEILNREPFKTLLGLYGDPLGMLKKAEAKGIHVDIFGFYSYLPTWEIDRDVTRRLGHYLKKIHEHRSDLTESYDRVHGKIIELVKQNPQMISGWVEEMFSHISKQSCGTPSPVNQIPTI